MKLTRLGPAIALAGLFAIGLFGMGQTSYIPVSAAVIPHVQFEAELNSFEPWQEFISPDGKHRLCSPNTAAHVCNGARVHAEEQGATKAMSLSLMALAVLMLLCLRPWAWSRR